MAKFSDLPAGCTWSEMKQVVKIFVESAQKIEVFLGRVTIFVEWSSKLFEG